MTIDKDAPFRKIVLRRVPFTVLGAATIEFFFAARIAKLCARSPKQSILANLSEDLPREKKI